MSLEQAPGELAGLADSLTVLLPWGSLLGALACAQPSALARLGALCRPGGEVRIVIGYGAAADARAIGALGLPSLEEPSVLDALEGGYRREGLAVRAQRLSVADVRELGTTWAGKLAFAGGGRAFVELRGPRGGAVP
jgi:hypothetical protein